MAKQKHRAALGGLLLALAAVSGCAQKSPAKPSAPRPLQVAGDEARLDRPLTRTRLEVEFFARLSSIDHHLGQLEDEALGRAELGQTELATRLRAIHAERDEAWREQRLLPLIHGRVAGKMRADLGERVARLERAASELSRVLREDTHPS